MRTPMLKKQLGRNGTDDEEEAWIGTVDGKATSEATSHKKLTNYLNANQLQTTTRTVLFVA